MLRTRRVRKESAGISAIKSRAGSEQADILRIALDESVDQQQPRRNAFLRCCNIVLIQDAGGEIVGKMLARLVDDACTTSGEAGGDNGDDEAEHEAHVHDVTGNVATAMRRMVI